MRRLVELPWLDDRKNIEAGGADNQVGGPRQPSFWYNLPIYIRDVDLANEIIVVSNPSSKPASLAGHYLTDRDQNHRIDFADDFVMAPGTDVYVYCAPGKLNKPQDELQQPNLLNLNKDGRVRKKELLNPISDKISLMDANNVDIAAFEVTAADEEEDGHGGQGEETKRLYLYRLEELQTANVGRIVTTLQGLRLVLAVLGFIMLLVNELVAYMAISGVLLLLDLVARYIDPLRLPRSKQRVFATIADRVEAVGLLIALITGTLDAGAFYYEAAPTNKVRLGMGLLLVETLSSWFEILVDMTNAVAPFPQLAAAGGKKRAVAAAVEAAVAAEAAVQIGPYRKWVKLACQRVPWLVALVTAGNHLYFLMAVAAMAHAKEGDVYGIVTGALNAMTNLVNSVPFLEVLTRDWHLLLVTVYLGAVYRVILIWAELNDLLEGKV